MELSCDIVICFVVFSFCGWACESVFCSILERKPVNRGFLNGPLCPVYGFGGLIVVFALGPLRGRYIELFCCGALACTALEYATSWILEKMFHTKWWDYSGNRFHINGRVCLSFSLVFGFLSVAAVELMYPPITRALTGMPDLVKLWLAAGMLSAMAADCAATVTALVRLNGKLEAIKKAMDELLAKLETVRGDKLSLGQMIEEFRKDSAGRYGAIRQSAQSSLSRLETLTGKIHFQHKRIMRAFPNMRSIKYQEQLGRWRESLSGFGRRIKKKP